MFKTELYGCKPLPLTSSSPLWSTSSIFVPVAQHVCMDLIGIPFFSWINPFGDKIPSWLLFHRGHYRLEIPALSTQSKMLTPSLIFPSPISCLTFLPGAYSVLVYYIFYALFYFLFPPPIECKLHQSSDFCPFVPSVSSTKPTVSEWINFWKT